MQYQMDVDTYRLDQLLACGTDEFHRGNRSMAVTYFKEALTIDSRNEKALMWCATLTSDPFDARIYLRRLLQVNPDHEQARSYYQLAEQRCAELRADTSMNWHCRPHTKRDSSLPRLGEYFINSGVLNELQVKAALQYQECLLQEGRSQPLGSILVSFGYISAGQLEAALNYLETGDASLTGSILTFA